MPPRHSAQGALNLPVPPGRPGHPQVWHPDFDSRQNKVVLRYLYIYVQALLFPNAMRHRVVSCFVKPRAVRFQRCRSHRIRLRGVCLFFLGRLTDWLIDFPPCSNMETPKGLFTAQGPILNQAVPACQAWSQHFACKCHKCTPETQLGPFQCLGCVTHKLSEPEALRSIFASPLHLHPAWWWHFRTCGGAWRWQRQ